MLSEQYRLDDLEAEETRLSDRTIDAREEAFATPVNSLAELAEKVAFMKEEVGDSPREAHIDLILADIRRLAGERC